jgi:hypothetical protein
MPLPADKFERRTDRSNILNTGKAFQKSYVKIGVSQGADEVPATIVGFMHKTAFVEKHVANMTFLIFGNVFIDYKNHICLLCRSSLQQCDVEGFMHLFAENKKAPEAGCLRGLKIKNPNGQIEVHSGGYDVNAN